MERILPCLKEVSSRTLVHVWSHRRTAAGAMLRAALLLLFCVWSAAGWVSRRLVRDSSSPLRPLPPSIRPPCHNRRCSAPPLLGAQRQPTLTLAVDDAVEVWHGNRLCVGNYRARAPPPSRALEVELGCGTLVKVDAGQIIDAWPADSLAPNSTAEWELLERLSATLLRELPTHMIDLRPFWQQLTIAGKTQRGVVSFAKEGNEQNEID